MLQKQSLAKLWQRDGVGLGAKCAVTSPLKFRCFKL